jgi:hypothetical protein
MKVVCFVAPPPFFPQRLVIAMEIEKRNQQKQSLLFCFLLIGNIYKFREFRESVISTKRAHLND